MKKSKIIYSINVEDIQTVALDEIERTLSEDEIERIKNCIGDKIQWYDTIADSINEEIKR